MRIIGGHDYFDSAMGFGIDKTIVFNRKQFSNTPCTPHTECGLKFPHQHQVALKGVQQCRGYKSAYIARKHFLECVTMVIWFAGVRYGGIRAALTDKNTHKVTQHFFWDHDTFTSFLHELGAEVEDDKGWISNAVFRSSTLKQHFTDSGTEIEKEWLISNGISIAILDITRGNTEDGWRFNCDGLKDIGFAKVLDAYSAFQNLSQWIGGVLPRPTNPIVEIKDEKTKLLKHGMDKWSFKTMPQLKT